MPHALWKWHLGHDEQFWLNFRDLMLTLGDETGQPRIIHNVSMDIILYKIRVFKRHFER